MFKRKPRELVIPPAAQNDPKATELVRVWAANGQQHVTISVEAWQDPATWGIVLVDLARHVASYYAENRSLQRDEVLLRIKNMFEAEWQSPSSETKGSIIQ
jgi:hypothetical protein